MTMFGLSAGLPSAARRFCQRRFRARPPSIAASLEPVVEHPVASAASGACQRRLRMLTQRISSSAVCGYSSLSIMFLSKHSAMSFSACGSIHVVTNVARFIRALPSSISSSWTIWYATSGDIPPVETLVPGDRAALDGRTAARRRGSSYGCSGPADASTPYGRCAITRSPEHRPFGVISAARARCSSGSRP